MCVHTYICATYCPHFLLLKTRKASKYFYFAESDICWEVTDFKPRKQKTVTFYIEN